MDGKLVDQIVEKVLMKLKASSLTTYLDKKKMLFVGNRENCRTIVDMFENEYLVDELSEISNLEDYEGILLPSLSCIQISSIWNCMPIDDITEWTIKAILKGKKTLVHGNELELNDLNINRESAVYERILTRFKELKEDGVSVIGESLSEEIEPDRICDGTEVRYEDKLLTEKSLKKFSNSKISKIVISKRTIITPLAKDLIRNLDIDIIQE